MSQYLVYQPCGHSFLEDASLPTDCPLCHKEKKVRKHKHNARPVKPEEHGYFHSTGEFKRYNDLVLLQKSGIIRNLERQKKYILNTIQQSVVWDFYYLEMIDGAEREITEDYKGFITPEYRRKKKAFQNEYPSIIFRETKAAQAKTARRRFRQAFRRKKAAR